MTSKRKRMMVPAVVGLLAYDLGEGWWLVF